MMSKLMISGTGYELGKNFHCDFHVPEVTGNKSNNLSKIGQSV